MNIYLFVEMKKNVVIVLGGLVILFVITN